MDFENVIARTGSPRLFEVEDMSTGYVEIVDAILAGGRDRSPRGMLTREIPNATIVLREPRLSHPSDIGRGYGRAIIAAEALGLIGGVADPDLMLSAASSFKQFFDAGQLHGSYGPRIRGQLPNVVDKLKKDPDTRQAVLQIWDARYDQAGWTPRDLPCTLSLAFAIYDGRLEMSTTMRSNDIWLGTAHDIPMFTALQLTVASALGLEPGPYVHNAYSLHLYERDFSAAIQMLEDYEEPHAVLPYGGGVYSEGGIEQGMERARLIFDGNQDHLIPTPTPQEEWYMDVLRPHTDRVHDSRQELCE